ncbi:hypothetical protein [Patulibacter americanus]|uniref:hypothetical protein n=1 Tax=Patulibacter americanus TaxID=588672 RepID=UPI0003B6AD45|nr:hypothetical protein [Patulibacter americanus]
MLLAATTLIAVAVAGVVVLVTSGTRERTFEFGHVAAIDDRVSSKVTVSVPDRHTIRVTFADAQSAPPEGRPNLHTFGAITEMFVTASDEGECPGPPGRRLFSYQRSWEPGERVAYDQTTGGDPSFAFGSRSRANLSAGAHVDLPVRQGVPDHLCVDLLVRVLSPQSDGTEVYRSIRDQPL